MLKRQIRVLLLLVLCCASTSAQSPATADLRGSIEQITRDAQGRVGAVAMVLETGASVAVQGGKRFPMQSVYKLPIAMAVLDQVDRGRLNLEQRIGVRKRDFVSAGQHSPIRDRYPGGVELSLDELLRFNVSESDGTACDVLLRVIGGAPVVNRYLQSLGIQGIRVVTTEKAMGRDQ